MLARLVARVRDAAMQRLWDVLAAMVTPEQVVLLERCWTSPKGARTSDLERLRKGPTSPSGKAMVVALNRVAEVTDLGLGTVALDGIPRLNPNPPIPMACLAEWLRTVIEGG